jgi:hypothetical protein
MSASLERSLIALDEEYSEHAQRGFAKDPDSFLGRLPDGISDGIRKRSLKDVGSQVPIGNREFNNQSRSEVSRPDDSFRDYMKAEMQKRG